MPRGREREKESRREEKSRQLVPANPTICACHSPTPWCVCVCVCKEEQGEEQCKRGATGLKPLSVHKTLARAQSQNNNR